MELSKEVRYSLPADVNPHRITQHVKLLSGLNSPIGESHLVLVEGELIVLSKGKAAEEFQVIRVPDDAEPELLQEDDVLMIPAANGTHRLAIPSTELGPVAFLLQLLQSERAQFRELQGSQAASGPDAAALAPTAPDEPLDPSVVDPDELKTHFRVAIRQRQWNRARGICERLGDTSVVFAPDAEDAQGVLDAIRKGELTEAFLRTDLGDTGLLQAKDELLMAISDLLAATDRPVWAAACRLACVDSGDESTLAGLFRTLGKDLSREEHVDEVLDQFEQARSAEIAQRILQNRTQPLWRELRARLAGRRGGHAMALRELKLLNERFPGVVTIDTAYLRALKESNDANRCQQLLIRCADEYRDPKDTVRILSAAHQLGIPLYAVTSAVRRLHVACRQDVLLMNWLGTLQLEKPSGSGLLWMGLGAAAAAAGLGVYLVLL